MTVNVIRKDQFEIGRIGLSTDTWPTVGVAQGTERYDHDKGDTYIFLDGAWGIKQNPPTAAHLMGYDIGSLTWVALPVGGGTEAGALRVTIASDSTGVLTVDDGGGSITVDGTVSTKTNLTPQAPVQVSVDLISEQLVAGNATRTGLIIVNTSTTAYVSLGFGAAAVLKSGAYLFPGGVFNMDEFSFWNGAVNAISSEAATIVSVQDYAV